jgi:hypothetical protein
MGIREWGLGLGLGLGAICFGIFACSICEWGRFRIVDLPSCQGQCPNHCQFRIFISSMRVQKEGPSEGESDGLDFAVTIPKKRSRSEPTLGTPNSGLLKGAPGGSRLSTQPVLPCEFPFFEPSTTNTNSIGVPAKRGGWGQCRKRRPSPRAPAKGIRVFVPRVGPLRGRIRCG